MIIYVQRMEKKKRKTCNEFFGVNLKWKKFTNLCILLDAKFVKGHRHTRAGGLGGHGPPQNFKLIKKIL